MAGIRSYSLTSSRLLGMFWTAARFWSAQLRHSKYYQMMKLKSTETYEPEWVWSVSMSCIDEIFQDDNVCKAWSLTMLPSSTHLASLFQAPLSFSFFDWSSGSPENVHLGLRSHEHHLQVQWHPTSSHSEPYLLATWENLTISFYELCLYDMECVLEQLCRTLAASQEV